MEQIRCHNCGLVNFATEVACRRCGASLSAYPYAGPQQPWGVYGGGQAAYHAPARSGSPVKSAIYVILVVAVGVVSFQVARTGVVSLFGSPKPSWREYSPAGADYSVSMPAAPKETTQSQPVEGLGSLTLYMSMVEYRDSACMVGYCTYPNIVSRVSTDELLDAAADGAVQNSGLTLKSKKPISLGGHQGVELEMTIPPGKPGAGGRAISRIYWAPPRMYMTFIGGTESANLFQERETFLKSFRLKR